MGSYVQCNSTTLVRNGLKQLQYFIVFVSTFKTQKISPIYNKQKLMHRIQTLPVNDSINIKENINEMEFPSLTCRMGLHRTVSEPSMIYRTIYSELYLHVYYFNDQN